MPFAHAHPFDPTYGYDAAALRRVGHPAPPHDFAAFWQSTYQATLAVPPHAQLRETALRVPGLRTYEVDFDSLDGFRVGGFVTMPESADANDPATLPARGMVVGHGYGGRNAPEPRLPGPPAVAIYPCARGFDRSARRELPGDAPRHVIFGLADRSTYIHRACVADLFAATGALLALFPDRRGPIDYLGQSFGGGIGALALPWEPRWRAALLDVPSFGNHPLRATLPNVGSGESVRHYVQKHPEAMDVLRYFDAATAGAFVTCPTFVAAAEFDPAVAPPGQFAIYNALKCPKALFVREAAHFDWAGQGAEDDRLFEVASEWFESV